MILAASAYNRKKLIGGIHELLKTLLATGLPICDFCEEELNLQASYMESVRTGVDNTVGKATS